MPVYNRQMIFYPLDTLKRFGLQDILIVSGGNHLGGFIDLLGDGSDYEVNLTYRVQKEAGGIAQALGVAEDFSSNADNVVVILGDNIFENDKLIYTPKLNKEKAAIYVKEVEDAKRFGVLNKDKTKIIEKPKDPETNLAVTGLYIYPKEVFNIIPTLIPSARGESEITDVNNHFLLKEKCAIINYEGFWSDAGTFESLHNSSEWVKNNLK